tara:strand:+ start:45609 stop:45755 length:147 start_codon:yes stop_codon:yes gene_type:complete
MSKADRFKKAGKSTAGLEREIAFVTKDSERPAFKTGREADPRLKKYNS